MGTPVRSERRLTAFMSTRSPAAVTSRMAVPPAFL